MRILITRPEPQASALAAELLARGHDAIRAPMFRIEDLSAPLPEITDFAGLILSSAHGVAALARRTDVREIPVLAVGPQTARAARQKGFRDVREGGGTGKSMMAELHHFVPAGSPILHISAPEGKTLTRTGYSITRLELYTSRAAATLPEAARSALTENALDGAMFFSPRSARVFCERVQEAGLAKRTAFLTAFCISETTRDALAGCLWNKIRVAAEPDRAAMLALLP